MDDSTPLGPNPSGLCMCGCGQKTAIAKGRYPAAGHVHGQPKRYLRGHHWRKSPVDYIEQDCGYETPCWVWQLNKQNHDRGGYGKLHIKGQHLLAHRVYYERYKGPVPEGMQLDHLCRNRACVNPDHLEPVTGIENHRRGASVKLTAEQVHEIKVRLAQGERTGALASDFGVSHSAIHSIKTGRTWRDVA